MATYCKMKLIRDTDEGNHAVNVIQQFTSSAVITEMREIFTYGSSPVVVLSNPTGTTRKAMGFTNTKANESVEEYNQFFINSALINVLEGKSLNRSERKLINKHSLFKNNSMAAMLANFFTIGHEDASAKNYEFFY